MNILSLTEELESFIQSMVPDAVQVTKYGGTLFTLRPAEKEGQFCGVFAYKQHVQISFSKGAFLDDPKNVLSGTGKLRRHINLKSLDDVDKNALAILVTQASNQ